MTGAYPVPNAGEGIAPLVDRLQLDTETHPNQRTFRHLDIFYNRPGRDRYTSRCSSAFGRLMRPGARGCSSNPGRQPVCPD